MTSLHPIFALITRFRRSPLMRPAAGVLAAVALLALSGALALPAQAQTTTAFVSNLEEILDNNAASIMAQSFTAGSNPDGYTLSDVELEYSSGPATADFTVTRVKIRKDNAGVPGDLVANLSNPATFSSGSLSFAAPPNTMLEADKTYWVVINEGYDSTAQRLRFFTTSSGDQAVTLADPNWSIADTRLWKNTGTASWEPPSDRVVMLAIKGTAVGGGTPSTDATLTDLVVNDGNSDLTLTPTFASDTETYTAMVVSTVAEVTVTQTLGDSGASIEYLDGDDATLTDADTGVDGHQVPVVEGDNVIKVKVTAADGNTTKTYTVTVSRAAAASTPGVLVSNMGQADSGPGSNINDTWLAAQGFSVPSGGGYTLTSVEILVTLDISSTNIGSLSVSVWSADSSGHPDSSLHTLTNPASVTKEVAASFTAPASATLEAGNTYVVLVDYDLTGNRNWMSTNANSEDATSTAGWTIANTGLYRARTATSWTNRGSAFFLQVNGTAVASSDATLSGLTVTAGGTDLVTFASGTTDYAASVANAVAEVTVTAMTTDSGATIEYLDGDDATLTDADTSDPGHQVALEVRNNNVIKVKVTAQDGVTTQTYRVTVGRAASTDATLTDLVVNDGTMNLTLTPTFASGMYTYTASVVNAVAQVTVTPTKNDSGATIEYLDASDMTLDDAGTDAGHQVAVAVGDTVIKVKVTAQDGNTTQTYTVTVKRAAAANADATLSNLVVNDGTTDLTLSPGFVSGTTTYTAMVVNTVAEVTVTPTKSDTNATIEYLDASDATLDDANTSDTGHQVAVVEGDNVVKVKVTAADTTTTRTYTVTVKRAAPPTCTLNTDDLWCGVVTVGAIQIEEATHGYGFDSTVGGLSDVGDLSDTGFSVGTNPYTIDRVAVGSTAALAGIGTLHFSLTSALTAADRAKLVLHVDGNSDSFAFSDAHDPTASHTYQWPGTGLDWSSEDYVTLRLREAPADADATLSALAVNDGSRNLTLRPGFAPGTTSYRVWVANAIAEVTVTATTNHAEARIDWLDGSDMTLTDADTDAGHQVAVGEGDNVIKVKVTAKDGNTTQTYTVTVTRRAVDAPGEEGALRLAEEGLYTHPDGYVGVSGRAEIFHAGRWGTVSSDGFSRSTITIVTVDEGSEVDASGYTETEYANNAPALFCEAMGYNAGEYASGYGRPEVPSQPSESEMPYYPVGSTYPSDGPEPIWLDDLTCLAGDADLTGESALPEPLAHCRYAGWGLHNSNHSNHGEDAGVRCWNEAGSATAAVAEPLTAAFEELPEAHDGETAFSFRIAFSEAVAVTPEAMRTHSLMVGGGAVTGVARVDGETGIWEITVTPDTQEALSISLPPVSDCDADGAVCTPDRRSLSTWAAAIVTGPADQPEENTAATGTPTISGTVQVGATLTADTSDIADDDGLENVSFNHQWVADDTAIQNATNSTYTLADADEGKAIKVQVSFTDDGGNDETLTSSATEAVEGNEESITSKDVAAWSATMTVEWVYQGYGYYSTDAKKAGSLSPASFNVDGTTYTVKMVETQGWWTYIGLDQELPFDFVLELDGTPFVSDDASFASYSYGNIYRWEGTGLSLMDGDTVEVRLLRALEDEKAVNSAATGAATISGTVQVGETLTADTSGIADADGLENAVFTYQWLADDGEIQGATNADYTLTDADEGKTIKVQVSFTDDADNEETLTSTATVAVAAATQPNNPAAGAPTIRGTVQVGDTLTADTSGISDDDGLDNVSFGYQWLADDTVIQGATNSTYILVEADEGKAIKVQVSFTDNAGNDETLTSTGTEKVSFAVQPQIANSPAKGAPTISGTVQVGETLTADTSGISDDDGLENASLIYQWLADDTAIAGATGSTYTLADADEGKAIKVHVSFTDDGGNDETLTSEATAAVAGNEESMTSEDVAAWSATMTVEWVYQGYGYYSTDAKKAGSLSPASFQVDGTTYTVNMVETQGWMYIGTDRELPFDFALELDGARFASDDASFNSYSYGNIYTWKRAGLSWRDGDTIEVRLLRAVEDETVVNSAATGAPIISGTPQVGETLTADTSGIADDDGLDNVSFNHQWLADDTAIQGATNSTYTLADADEGKAIKVQVSFTDNVGNDETLTSAATAVVSAATQTNNPATGAPTVSGTVQVGETLTSDTSGIADDDGLDNVSYSYQWLADDTAIQGATNSTYTLVEADEGKYIKVQVSFTDNAGNDETLTSAATAVVSAATQPNSPATGSPTIRGTVQVGETLTADTSGIADEDRLDNASFSYQWLADDTAIQGATNSTYTLVDADAGNAIKVQVSFSDDAGNEETLTSGATDAVAAPEPPAKPTGLSATATHEQVTLTWDHPNDDSIIGYVILRRNRETDTKGEFTTLVSDTGNADTTYSDDNVAAETRYTYRIKAINEQGMSERSRWFHIDTTTAPVPAQPTGLSATATHDQAVLTWDNPGDDGITGYVILRRNQETDAEGQFTELVSNTGNAETTYSDNTVAAETRYTYRIKAINEHGVSERSRWFHLNTPAAPVPEG